MTRPRVQIIGEDKLRKENRIEEHHLVTNIHQPPLLMQGDM